MSVDTSRPFPARSRVPCATSVLLKRVHALRAVGVHEPFPVRQVHGRRRQQRAALGVPRPRGAVNQRVVRRGGEHRADVRRARAVALQRDAGAAASAVAATPQRRRLGKTSRTPSWRRSAIAREHGREQVPRFQRASSATEHVVLDVASQVVPPVDEAASVARTSRKIRVSGMRRRVYDVRVGTHTHTPSPTRRLSSSRPSPDCAPLKRCRCRTCGTCSPIAPPESRTSAEVKTGASPFIHHHVVHRAGSKRHGQVEGLRARARSRETGRTRPTKRGSDHVRRDGRCATPRRPGSGRAARRSRTRRAGRTGVRRQALVRDRDGDAESTSRGRNRRIPGGGDGAARRRDALAHVQRRGVAGGLQVHHVPRRARLAHVHGEVQGRAVRAERGHRGR